MTINDLKTVKTGGKLYIAGEYSVLTPGQTALIAFVPIYMSATIQLASDVTISSDMFDYTVDLTPDAKYSFIQESVATFQQFYGKELPPFRLNITGKLERDGLKFGIGSSGSVTVLTIKALSALVGMSLPADTVFKLASYTLLKLGDNGSMGDIACIAFEEMIAYRSFNREMVSELIKTADLKTVLESDWGYDITKITPNMLAEFLVGWTKEPAISKDMIAQVTSHITPEFLQETDDEVKRCCHALITGDKLMFRDSLERVSQLLDTLHPSIYSNRLKELKKTSVSLDVIAKSSGAGGGDCGVAISFCQHDTEVLVKRWKNAGIDLLYQERWENG